MGNKLLGKDIAGILASKLGPKLLPFTLIKVVTGARTVGDPAAGPAAVETPRTCRGILEDYRDSQFDGTTIKRGDRKALLLGDTIAGGAIPEPNDKLTAEGRTYVIVGIPARDPDAATYVCQVRGA
jgi:hypothetical protein